MKIKELQPLNEHLCKNLGELLEHVRVLCEKHGEATELECEPYEDTYIVLYRNENIHEKELRENIEKYTVELKGCSDIRVHNDAVEVLGRSIYDSVIRKLNEEK